MIGLGDPGTRCSAAGCTAAAVSRVNWRNPRIHGPERVKVWLACDAHRETLRDYLATRGFPVQVTDLDVVLDAVTEPA
ncbi:hypothetical protein [Protaetiibacter mangrovi]|uniref:Acetone carboxylase n=1 Tax=Protaetiibacter mangrovi TaxID=2970926 RepID=A0ABT1ZC38_9MICO|nr:hypothetical protein [Protaetiibacter mangrovi]MCS0498270.1 hypothetical protein [Protaetiibacter mangrovi]